MRIRKLRCSFCRKTEVQVSKLVAGPRLIVGPKLYICNECVAVANSIMQGNPPPTPAVSRSLLQKVQERWRHLLQRSGSREASVA
jgi:ATP-dependent Clp protease ATP-binding subunit ClpX